MTRNTNPESWANQKDDLIFTRDVIQRAGEDFNQTYYGLAMLAPPPAKAAVNPQPEQAVSVRVEKIQDQIGQPQTNADGPQTMGWQFPLWGNWSDWNDKPWRDWGDWANHPRHNWGNWGNHQWHNWGDCNNHKHHHDNDD